VAGEAIREELPLAELSKKYHLHPSVVKRWKAEALSGLSQVFDKGLSAIKTDAQEKIEQLERKVGQLTMENDFFKKKLGPCAFGNDGK
jgi:transposase